VTWKELTITSSTAVFPADTPTDKEQLREKLAKFLHEDIWAHWMKYLFTQTTEVGDGCEEIQSTAVEHWKRQMNTLYEDLPEARKKSDRDLAEKLMKLLEQ